LLPSEPVTVTWVALPATTVNVEEPPAVIDAGLAVMLTVGAEVVASPGPTVPHPASTKRKEKVIASGDRMARRGRETHTFFMFGSFLLFR
jgi:hypothetical protein